MGGVDWGYEPTRVGVLQTSTTNAINALRSIDSTDPSAAAALTATRGLMSTLENDWMPAITAIISNDPLSGPTRAWKKGVDGPEPINYCPFDALNALFPGDDDITAEEIAEKIQEILSMRPGQRQWQQMMLLGQAFRQIAEDPVLAEAVVEELGPDSIRHLYAQLYGLGLEYPLVPTDVEHLDSDRWVGLDLTERVADPFALVLVAASHRPGGRDVVEEVIENAADAWNAWDAAPLAGLARVEGLPPAVAAELLDAVRALDPYAMPTMLPNGDNTVFPGIEYDSDALELFVIANNPSLIESEIYGPNGFVDGGEELLTAFVRQNGQNWQTDRDIGQSLGDIVQHIIDITPPDELIVPRAGGPGNSGVLFDLTDLILEHDLKVPGLQVLDALGPYLPVIMGSIPGSSERYSPSEVRAILKDLLEDLSPSEIEDALTIVTASAIAQLPITITTGDFDGSGRANWSVPNLLDSLFGPTAGAIEDIVKDDAEAAAFWRDAMNQAFGLIPIPGNAVAKWAIKRGVRELIDGFPMERDSPDAAVQAAQQALVENTVLALYADEDINAQIVDAALDDWPATRTLLVGDEPHIRPGGQELTVAEANEVHRALIEARRTGEPLDPEVFVQLPDVVNLIEELEDELTLSPERAKGNG